MSLASTLELLTNEEMAEADRLTIASGTPGSFLMEHAGATIAEEAERRVARPAKIAIFCGPGNNGGDGFVAARLLAGRGFSVEVGLLGKLEALRGDAASAAKAWAGPTVPVDQLDLEKADLAIDALFGAGLARNLDGLAKDTVLRLNEWTKATGKPIIAVDVPSGIDGSSGAIRGVAVKASSTVTFFRKKPGHLLLPGRLLCGETILADIGIPDSVLQTIKPKTFVNRPDFWKHLFPIPRTEGHKYSRGHAVIVSGGLSFTGAARLAARGALRAGAGLVTVATPGEALAVHAAALTAIMTRVCDGPEELTQLLGDRRKNALVMGPGLGVGEATRVKVLAALAADSHAPEPRRAIVLDADALTTFQGEAVALAHAIKASGAPVVLTPHDGEFARLFSTLEVQDAAKWTELGLESAYVQEAIASLRSGSKLERTRAAAGLTGAIVLLKGADTVVAEPSGRATIAEDLPPFLATAGSGDVLAGIVSGLLAQGMPAFEAASAAVWLHGAAARLFGPGLIAEDIPEMLPQVLGGLVSGPIRPNTADEG
jgi:hydroxyethylthiazole kinase-like uncharacterized protein yjeF